MLQIRPSRGTSSEAVSGREGSVLINEGLGSVSGAKVNIIEGAEDGVIKVEIHRATEGLFSGNRGSQISETATI